MKPARARLLTVLIAAWLQAFGAVVPVWAMAAGPMRPAMAADICAAHPVDSGSADAGQQAPAQRPDQMPCPHCQWCHGHPAAVHVAPVRLPVPATVRAVPQLSADSGSPRGPPPLRFRVRAPPAS